MFDLFGPESGPLSDMKVLDADSHLYETRALWAEHAPASEHDRCLRIVDDERGYSWLTVGDTRIEVLGVHDANDVAQPGRFRTRLAKGLPPGIPYDAMPANFWDPTARGRGRRGGAWAPASGCPRAAEQGSPLPT
ncbi:MAG: hypothetical protein FJW88_11185 [Actinobacteria bacterium]|nr:hypothetical protein [Actinomycetota bacterium]